MKLQALGYSLLANGLLLIALAFCAWQWAEAGAECDAKQANATVDANNVVRVDEARRDEKIDAVDRETKADTAKAVGKVEKQTHERAAAIDRVPVTGQCRAPVGLPSLDAAVDQANAAAGD